MRERSGFISAQLLEQIDDPDFALLILCWDNQAAVENFNRTNLLEASIQGLAALMPGVHIQRQGYQVSISTSAPVEEDTQSAAANTP